MHRRWDRSARNSSRWSRCSTRCRPASQEADELLELAAEDDDADTIGDISRDLLGFEKDVAALEFRRMFSGDMDINSAYLDIQSGAGGTEAQDWADMLLRMYLRWAEAHGYKAEVIEASAGEVAGIKECDDPHRWRIRIRLAADGDRRASPRPQIAV